jgi:hypothetical protein
MNPLHLATSALDDLVPSRSSDPEKKAPRRGEMDQLLIGYQRLLELAERISSTLLIRHNDWIIQVKGLRQHYLFENDDALMEMKNLSRSALEIGRREKERSGIKSLYTITHNDGAGFVIKDEQAENKSLKLSSDDGSLLPKIMAYLK